MNKTLLTPYFVGQQEYGLKAVAEADWALNDPVVEGEDEQGRCIVTHQGIRDFVAETIGEGNVAGHPSVRPISFAGDCCATIPVIAGLQQAGVEDFLYLWFDAHGDFNDWSTTPSNFLGGMPLAMEVGIGEQRMMDGSGATPITESQVMLIDGRDLDPGEQKLVSGSQIAHVKDVRALLHMNFGNRPVYVHFDADILHLDDNPAVSYPAEGGPRSGELSAVFTHLNQTAKIVAVSMSAWNPRMDGAEKSQAICMKLLSDLIS